jgi:hypothetical protein
VVYNVLIWLWDLWWKANATTASQLCFWSISTMPFFREQCMVSLGHIGIAVRVVGQRPCFNDVHTAPACTITCRVWRSSCSSSNLRCCRGWRAKRDVSRPSHGHQLGSKKKILFDKVNFKMWPDSASGRHNWNCFWPKQRETFISIPVSPKPTTVNEIESTTSPSSTYLVTAGRQTTQFLLLTSHPNADGECEEVVIDSEIFEPYTQDIPSMLKLVILTTKHHRHVEIDEFYHNTFYPCWNWQFRPRNFQSCWNWRFLFTTHSSTALTCDFYHDTFQAYPGQNQSWSIISYNKRPPLPCKERYGRTRTLVFFGLI